MQTQIQNSLPPGSLVYKGEKKEEKVSIELFHFDQNSFTEIAMDEPKELRNYLVEGKTSWINVSGLHETDLIQELGEVLSINKLILEDVLHTNQRAKMDSHDDHLYVVMRMLGIDPETGRMAGEQLSLVLGNNWIISFQEQTGDLFDVLRQRLREDYGTMRSKKADYLFYRLIDIVVDNYFHVVDKLSDDIEQLEDEIQIDPQASAVQTIQRTKRQLIRLRKAVVPLREVVNQLREEEPLISDNTRSFIPDLRDHVLQIADSVESQRELISGTMDMYMSTVSLKMNQVMQVLTIIATIFIPLTFIAGIYGMNFQYMPELSWEYGYFVVWGVMVAIFLGMLVYFRGKKWL
jgi:magnesium transporter